MLGFADLGTQAMLTPQLELVDSDEPAEPSQPADLGETDALEDFDE